MIPFAAAEQLVGRPQAARFGNDDGRMGVTHDVTGTDDAGGIHAPEKCPHIVVCRVLENLLGGADLDHAAPLHDSDAVADAQGLVQIMTDKDDGALVLFLKF